MRYENMLTKIDELIRDEFLDLGMGARENPIDFVRDLLHENDSLRKQINETIDELAIVENDLTYAEEEIQKLGQEIIELKAQL